MVPPVAPSSHGATNVSSRDHSGAATLVAGTDPLDQIEREPYTKLTAHQGRKLGADRPLWRRALSGIALLVIVVFIGVLIAVGIGVIAGLASLLIERAV